MQDNQSFCFDIHVHSKQEKKNIYIDRIQDLFVTLLLKWMQFSRYGHLKYQKISETVKQEN